MTWLYESPWEIGLTGASLLGILIFVLIKTGRRVVIAIMVGVLALTLGLLALERAVVTDREQITLTLQGAAAAVERNDLATVLEFISPSALDVRSYAQRGLSRLKVTEAWVGRDLEVTVNKLTSPPSARAKFTGVVHAKETQIPPMHIEAVLQKEGGRWLVREFQAQDMRRSER